MSLGEFVADQGFGIIVGLMLFFVVIILTLPGLIQSINESDAEFVCESQGLELLKHDLCGDVLCKVVCIDADVNSIGKSVGVFVFEVTHK